MEALMLSLSLLSLLSLSPLSLFSLFSLSSHLKIAGFSFFSEI
jgi:hypothetical protein